MGSVEERVAFLDGTVKGHSKMIDGIRESVVHLGERMDARFAEFGERMDARFAQVDDRIDRLETRMDRGFERVDERFDKMDAKMDRQFRWLVGILFTAMIAMLAILGRVLPAALQR